MDDYKEICDAVKEGIRIKLEKLPSVFYLWFNDMTLSSLTEDRAVFTTKTMLKKKVLSTKYIDMISDTLTEVIGFPVEVVIEADLEGEEKAPEKAPEKESAFSSDSLEKSAEQEKQIENLLSSTDTSKKSMLDDYTFENFIEGSSNKFAKAACYAVAKEPCFYNPLFETLTTGKEFVIKNENIANLIGVIETIHAQNPLPVKFVGGKQI